MLGKFSSVPLIIERLRGEGIDNFAVMEFVQGSRTRRWGIGWSFGGWRASGRVARGLGGAAGGSGLQRSWLPFPAEQIIEVGSYCFVICCCGACLFAMVSKLMHL